ncbi:MAG: dihydroorotase [Verrucomicrobiota bacterium]
MQTRLINARIVDPATGFDGPGEVGISDGIFADPHSLADPQVIDLAGKVVCPGFVDIHVHLRDPGQTHKEDLASGSDAAAAGGFTTIVAMPNTEPPADSPMQLQRMQHRLDAVTCVRVLQSASLTLGRGGAELADFGALRDAGAVALTDDGGCLSEAYLMREAMRNAHQVGLVVMDHCEDGSLARGTVVYESETARRLNLPARSRVAEELIVARDILLCRDTGCPVHIQHVSTSGAVALIRRARAEGLPVSAEATPHHLLLTHEACAEHGTLAKMNPPLGAEEDRQALIGALRDGTISTIATDHAPHTLEEKAVGFLRAPFGIIGLETAVPMCLTHLVHTGLLSLSAFVAAFTTGPCTALGLPFGTLRPGAPADITVLDLEATGTINPEAFRSQARNTPFANMNYRGNAVETWSCGIPSSEGPGIRPQDSDKSNQH